MLFWGPSAPPALLDKLSSLEWSKYLDGIVAATAIVSSVVGVTKNFSERSQSRSNLLSKRDKELDRAGKLAGFYVQLTHTGLSQSHVELLQSGIQIRLLECVSTLEQVNLKLVESEKDPNTKLSTWSRLLLWFKPLGWREFVPHMLTYICFVCALWAIYGTAAADDGSSRYLALGLSAVAVAFTFIFHSWSLDERRRKFGYYRKLGKVTQLLLVQAPENFRMLSGQLFFFVSITLSCVALIAAAIFLVQSLKSQPPPANTVDSVIGAVEFLFVFLLTSFYTSIFHGWATAEFKASNCTAKLLPLRFKGLRHSLENLKHYCWRLIKFSLAYFFGLFFIVFAAVGIGVMLFDTRQRDWTGTVIAAIAIIIGIAPIYGSTRVLKIHYSLDQLKESEGQPKTNAAASGASAA